MTEAKKLLDSLRADLGKSSIMEIKHEADKFAQVDPRIDNKPLPNDSVMTKQFGARAYVTDAYYGFVWRNGHWYRITDNLKFVESSPERIQYYLHKKSSKLSVKAITSEGIPDESANINDAYIPVKVDGIRYFIKKNIANNNTYDSCNVYNPMTQAIEFDKKMTFDDLYKPQFEDGEI